MIIPVFTATLTLKNIWIYHDCHIYGFYPVQVLVSCKEKFQCKCSSTFLTTGFIFPNCEILCVYQLPLWLH